PEGTPVMTTTVAPSLMAYSYRETCRCCRYTSGTDLWAGPHWRTSWMTPTRANEVGDQSERPTTAPIGSRPERYRFTNVSFTSATGALPAPSDVARSRPLISRTPAVPR